MSKAKLVFDYEAWVMDRVQEAVETWWCTQLQNEWAHLHLYYRQSVPGTPGALTAAEDCPEGFVLADPRRISPAWTKERASYFIAEVSRRLPILPHER